MPDQNTERQPVKMAKDLGIFSTQSLESEDLENFLNGEEEVEELEEGQENTPPPKKNPPVKTPVKKEEPKQEKEEPEVPSGEDLINQFLEEGEEDKNKKPKEKEEGQNEEGEGAGQESDENPFPGLAKDLLDLGILTLEDGEEGLDIEDGQALAERFEIEKRKGAIQTLEAFLGRFGPEYEELFDNVFVKGVDPLDYLGRYAKIKDLESIDLTDELNQERVIREKLRREGMTSEEIGKKIEKYRNYNDLEEEAGYAHKFLMKAEQDEKTADEQAKAQKLQQQQQQKLNFSNKVRSILQEKLKTKEWDGIPVDLKFAQETLDYLTKEKYRVGKDQTISEFDKEIMDLNKPENYELKVKMAMLFRMVKTDPTLSRIQKKAVTKEANQLFQNVNKKFSKEKENKQKEQTEPAKSWWS